MEEHSISIKDGVDLKIDDRRVIASGKNGEVEKDFDDPRFNDFISIEKSGGNVVVKYDEEKRKIKAVAGTIRAHINNMMDGVTNGFKYKMRIVYTHFPITVAVEKDRVVVKNFLGERGVRSARVAGKTQIKIDKESIELTGSNVEDVSQTAANIEKACKLTKRDRRIFQDGIYIESRGL